MPSVQKIDAFQEVGAFDAKTNLPKLLKAVENGKTIYISRRGIRIAILSPIPHKSGRTAKIAVAEFRSRRKGIKWSGEMNTKKAIEEGRR